MGGRTGRRRRARRLGRRHREDRAPTGDPARTFQRMLGGDMPTNPVFEMDNRSKRSIALDLTHPDGRAVAEQLIADADVFVTNVRLGGLERLGLDHSTLCARYPRLVYAAITGYGTEGPDADRAAYDVAAFWATIRTRPHAHSPGRRPALPARRDGRPQRGAHRRRRGLCRSLLPGTHRRGPVRQHVAAAPGDLHPVVRSLDHRRLGAHPRRGRARGAMGNPCINNYVAGDGRRFWVVGLEGERHWPPLARGPWATRSGSTTRASPRPPTGSPTPPS